MTDTRDPRYAAVPRLGGGWGVIDYREGRYLEMTERSDEPQRQTAERLAGEANAEATPDLAAIVAGIDQALEVRGKNTLMIRMQRDWPAIRAALEQRAALEETLRELVKEAGEIDRRVWDEWRGPNESEYEPAEVILRAEALLARSAAANEGERGRAWVRKDWR